MQREFDLPTKARVFLAILELMTTLFLLLPQLANGLVQWLGCHQPALSPIPNVTLGKLLKSVQLSTPNQYSRDASIALPRKGTVMANTLKIVLWGHKNNYAQELGIYRKFLIIQTALCPTDLHLHG